MGRIIHCAHCDRELNVAADLAGKPVRCPSCKETTKVPEARAARRREPEEDEQFTARPSRSGRDAEEPRRSRRELSDDYVPRRRQSASSSAWVWILGGVGGLVCIGLVAAVLLFTMRPGAVREAEAVAKKGGDEKPQGPMPTELSPEMLAAIKRATVFVKVEGKLQGNAVSGSGSGFVTRVEGDRALIITNHHVVDPQLLIVGEAERPEPDFTNVAQIRPINPQPKIPINPQPKKWGPVVPPVPQPKLPPQNWLPPRQFVPIQPVVPSVMIARLKDVNVTVVFDSGQKTERTMRAEVLGVDPGWDLAVLEVKNLKDLPEPITYTKNPELMETMPVYTFGFPFGDKLKTNNSSPAITVGRATISSLRKDKEGDLALVQIDGALNPGNSGGPVVDARGELVGIAVAIVRDGNGIGLLIPGVELRKTMQQGRIGDPHIEVSRPPGSDKVSVNVEVVRVDPMSNMTQIGLYYVPGSKVKGTPELLAGQADVAMIDLCMQKQLAKGTVALASGETELVTQVVHTNSDGKKYKFKVQRQNIANAGPVKVANAVPSKDQEVAPSRFLGMLFDLKEIKDAKAVHNNFNFGLSMTDHEDGKKPKSTPLIYGPVGQTNNILLRIDGEDTTFGKPGTGEWVELRPRFTTWQAGGIAYQKEGIGTWKLNKVLFTQTAKIVSGQPVETTPGVFSSQFDTCRVAYKIENQDSIPHHVGVRILLDTLIGANDGVPFAAPGTSGWITKKEFKEVPDFIMAFENGSMENPGTIAQLNLRIGRKLEPPSRVLVTRWPAAQKNNASARLAALERWEVPLADIDEDSSLVMYWPPMELKPGQTRELGYSFGAGSLAKNRGKSLAIATGGQFFVDGVLSVVCLVNDPIAAGSKVTLVLPKELSLLPGSDATQHAPAADGTRARFITWRVRTHQSGSFTLDVKTAGGLGLKKHLEISTGSAD